MNEDMPTTVMTIIVAMLIIGVGLFIIVVFVEDVGISSQSTETFAVIDPSVDQTLTLAYKPASLPSVQQFNGIVWQPVSSTFVSYNGRELTVQAGGLQG